MCLQTVALTTIKSLSARCKSNKASLPPKSIGNAGLLGANLAFRPPGDHFSFHAPHPAPIALLEVTASVASELFLLPSLARTGSPNLAMKGWLCSSKGVSGPSWRLMTNLSGLECGLGRGGD